MSGDTRAATVEQLRRAIEHAPAEPGPRAPGLLGWWTPDRVFVCAHCTGRMIRRGCSIPRGSTAVWDGDTLDVPGACVTCSPAPKPAA